jgi:hypothetical protein
MLLTWLSGFNSFATLCSTPLHGLNVNHHGLLRENSSNHFPANPIPQLEQHFLVCETLTKFICNQIELVSTRTLKVKFAETVQVLVVL